MKVSTLFGVIVSLLMGYSCGTRQQPMSYAEEIGKYRDETNDFMNNSEDSPFIAADSTIQLSYFPINEDYRVIATIRRMQDGAQLTLGTSDGKSRLFEEYAMLEFELKGQALKLLVLRGAEGGGLFLAFGDLTNDNTTYGGGRYINLSFSDQAEKITLDFNKAYNPYCEYSASYSCPLPPGENYLKIAVEAGEKLYKA